MRGKGFRTMVPRQKDRDDVHDAMLALRASGLSYPAIAGALDYFWGIRLTGDGVRGELRRLGEPKKMRVAA